MQKTAKMDKERKMGKMRKKVLTKGGRGDRIRRLSDERGMREGGGTKKFTGSEKSS